MLIDYHWLSKSIQCVILFQQKLCGTCAIFNIWHYCKFQTFLMEHLPKCFCWNKVIQWIFLHSEVINNYYILQCKIKMDKISIQEEITTSTTPSYKQNCYLDSLAMTNFPIDQLKQQNQNNQSHAANTTHASHNIPLCSCLSIPTYTILYHNAK